ncbi:type II toxin-antitoxin system PemK/MazF family toxin [Acetomicrobium sp. S15 = DSM 107314]|uniref:type II toxin-antitoxin system PemK/MazF family toxin n=1 Tax=Acetomicrobium sp. S15 = DSM 107314 TaxID=2529858 RepID=UPI0018E14EE4
MSEPSRGEIWLVDLNPLRGHEQAGRRPSLVISVNGFNYGPAGRTCGYNSHDHEGQRYTVSCGS